MSHTKKFHFLSSYYYPRGGLWPSSGTCQAERERQTQKQTFNTKIPFVLSVHEGKTSIEAQIIKQKDAMRVCQVAVKCSLLDVRTLWTVCDLLPLSLSLALYQNAHALITK